MIAKLSALIITTVPSPGLPIVQSVEAVLRLASAWDPDHEVGGLGEPQQPEQAPAGGHGEAGGQLGAGMLAPVMRVITVITGRC